MRTATSLATAGLDLAALAEPVAGASGIPGEVETPLLTETSRAFFLDILKSLETTLARLATWDMSPSPRRSHYDSIASPGQRIVEEGQFEA